MFLFPIFDTFQTFMSWRNESFSFVLVIDRFYWKTSFPNYFLSIFFKNCFYFFFWEDAETDSTNSLVRCEDIEEVFFLLLLFLDDNRSWKFKMMMISFVFFSSNISRLSQNLSSPNARHFWRFYADKYDKLKKVCL